MQTAVGGLFLPSNSETQNAELRELLPKKSVCRSGIRVIITIAIVFVAAVIMSHLGTGLELMILLPRPSEF